MKLFVDRQLVVDTSVVDYIALRIERSLAKAEALSHALRQAAPGLAVEVTDEETGQQAVLVHLEGGDFAAYSAICTHRQCVVGYSDGNLACPCHGSVFDPASGGAVVNGPATQPLPEIPVEVRDGEIIRA